MNDEVRRHVERELRQAFRPEFLNRIDDTIIFQALSDDDLQRIVGIQIDRLRTALADRRIDLEVTEAARKKLAEAGYDPAFGARPLKRAIQRLIQDPLALALLDGTFVPGAKVRAHVERGEIVLQPAEVGVH